MRDVINLVPGDALSREALTNVGLAACVTKVTSAEVQCRAVLLTNEHQEAVRLFASEAGCPSALLVISLDDNPKGEELRAVLNIISCLHVYIAVVSYTNIYTYVSPMQHFG